MAAVLGCYPPALWLRHGCSAWLTVAAALGLAVFVWLFGLPPTDAGRI